MARKTDSLSGNRFIGYTRLFGRLRIGSCTTLCNFPLFRASKATRSPQYSKRLLTQELKELSVPKRVTYLTFILSPIIHRTSESHNETMASTEQTPASSSSNESSSDIEATKPTEVCKFFLEDKCRFGDNCNKAHPPGLDQPQPLKATEIAES